MGLANDESLSWSKNLRPMSQFVKHTQALHDWHQVRWLKPRACVVLLDEGKWLLGGLSGLQEWKDSTKQWECQ